MRQATSKCVAKQLPGLGDDCGAMQVGGQTVYNFYCSGQASCLIGGSSNKGKCVAVVDDGQACDTTNGPSCQVFSDCVNGKCVSQLSICK